MRDARRSVRKRQSGGERLAGRIPDPGFGFGHFLDGRGDAFASEAAGFDAAVGHVFDAPGGDLIDEHGADL